MKKPKVLKTIFCIITFLTLTNKTFSQMVEKINYEIIKIPRMIQGQFLGLEEDGTGYKCNYNVDVSIEEDGTVLVIDSKKKWIVKYNLRNNILEKIADLNTINNKKVSDIFSGESIIFQDKIYIVSNSGLIEFDKKNNKANIFEEYRQVIVDTGGGRKFFYKGRKIIKEYPEKRKTDFIEKGIDIVSNGTNIKNKLSNKEMYKITKRIGLGNSFFKNSSFNNGILYYLLVNEKNEAWLIKDDINNDEIIFKKKILTNTFYANIVGRKNHYIYIYLLEKDDGECYLCELDINTIIIKRKIKIVCSYIWYCGETTTIIGPSWQSKCGMGKDGAFYVSGPFDSDYFILYKYNL